LMMTDNETCPGAAAGAALAPDVAEARASGMVNRPLGFSQRRFA
jgi:hypothetical protein